MPQTDKISDENKNGKFAAETISQNNPLRPINVATALLSEHGIEI